MGGREIAGRRWGDDKFRLDEALAQLCGELLLLTPALAQPHLRGGDGIGLELLDLLCTPDHVLRVDETLTLLDATRLARRVTIDIALDRLAPQQEEAAAQLGSFIDERAVSGGAADATPGILWLPLLTVPRPLVPFIEIKDGAGRLLPRPRQRDVRAVLVATAYYLFRNPPSRDWVYDKEDVALSEFDHRDHVARWLFQTALIQLSKDGRGSARNVLRAKELAYRGGSTPGGGPDLPKLIAQERDPRRRNALHAVHKVIASNDALLEVIDLLYSDYVVVVGVDREVRHHHVECSIPDVDALDTSSTRSWRHNLRAFDPQEHNFTVRAHVPVPRNVRQYRLNVDTASARTDEPLSVSLLAAVHFTEHPVQPALDTATVCADVLAGWDTSHEVSRSASEDERDKWAQRDAFRVRYAAAEAHSALEAMEKLADRRKRAADELGASRPGTPRIAPREAVESLQRAAEAAHDRVDTARRRVRTVMSTPPDLVNPDRAQNATEALNIARTAIRSPLMAVATVGDEVPGGDVARVRLNQRDENDRQARAIDIWVTISDECRSYSLTRVAPPFLIASLLYLIGGFVLRDANWLWALNRNEAAAKLANAQPAGIASLLLLIPAFALSRLHVPNQRDVAGLLRRPSLMLVASAVGALYVSAVVLATTLSTSTASRKDVEIITWTLSLAFGGFLLWFLWSLVAWVARHQRIWRPKGLSELFVDLDTRHTTSWLRPIRWFRVRLRSRYDRKAPDVIFDLTQPVGSHPGQERKP